MRCNEHAPHTPVVRIRWHAVLRSQLTSFWMHFCDKSFFLSMRCDWSRTARLMGIFESKPVSVGPWLYLARIKSITASAMSDATLHNDERRAIAIAPQCLFHIPPRSRSCFSVVLCVRPDKMKYATHNAHHIEQWARMKHVLNYRMLVTLTKCTKEK